MTGIFGFLCKKRERHVPTRALLHSATAVRFHFATTVYELFKQFHKAKATKKKCLLIIC